MSPDSGPWALRASGTGVRRNHQALPFGSGRVQEPENSQDRPIEPTILSPSGINLQLLDQDAFRAVQRLQSRGFEAYLVGGCVRDLLLGREPKDFDIATAARPQQVKRTFPRNSRIIGRRFKLAHLHFDNNRKILEVSTFRRTPQEGEDGEDLLILRDNEFGDAEEDALRRDFTVNALFLDPDEDRIIDYADGLQDLRNTTMRTIGEPVVRFREDPVRILRAAKFAGRLGFQVDPATLEAMAEVAPDLTRAAPPRLLEEILRLLRGAHALDSFQLLRDIGALKVMLPVVAEFLSDADQAHREVFWRILEALDQEIQSGGTVSNPVLLGTLFTLPVKALSEREGSPSVGTIAEEVLGPFSNNLRLPRRDAGCLKRICGVQHRFTNKGKRRFKISSFLRDPYFPDALRLFELTCMATGKGFEEVHVWRNRAIEEFGLEEDSSVRQIAEKEETEASSEGESEGGGRKRRRRRRRGRGRGGQTQEATASDEAGRSEEAPSEEARETRGKAGGKKRKKRERKPREARVSQDASPEAEPKESTKVAGKKKGRTAKKGASKKAAEKRAPKKREAGKKAPDKKAPEKKEAGKKGTKKTRAKTPRKRGSRDSRKRGGKVETIEPVAPDVSTFDMELDPKRVPSFGSIVEGKSKRRRAKVPSDGDGDEYKPPPPPTPGGDAPPPDDDTFGDW